MMNIVSNLPFDLQEYIFVTHLKRYKLRNGTYVKQIDQSKYRFLDYIMRARTYRIIHDDSPLRYRCRFSMKNLHDNPIRAETHVDDDMVDLLLEFTNNKYIYHIYVYRLKMKQNDNFSSEKETKDIYYKGGLNDDYFWDFFEISYEVK
jgi:hypothetical protein